MAKKICLYCYCHLCDCFCQLLYLSHRISSEASFWWTSWGLFWWPFWWPFRWSFWPSPSSNLMTHLVTPWLSFPTQLPKKPHTLLSLGRRCRPHDLQPETLMTPPVVSKKTFSTFIRKHETLIRAQAIPSWSAAMDAKVVKAGWQDPVYRTVYCKSNDYVAGPCA